MIPRIRHVVATRLAGDAGFDIAAESGCSVVAFEAQWESRWALEQSRIGGTVWDVACLAPVHAGREMLKRERSTLVGVALQAGLFVVQTLIDHAGTSSGAPGWGVRAMGIVAVRARHEALIDPVLERHRELGAHVRVAVVAEIHLLLCEQRLGRLRLMDRMAVRADDISPGVFGPANVGSGQGFGVAGEAAVHDFAGLFLREGEDCGFAAFCLDMRFAGAVTALAPTQMHWQGFVDGGFEMRILEEDGRDVRVAGAARLSTYKRFFRRYFGIGSKSNSSE